jgi:selenide,water dikinase
LLVGFDSSDDAAVYRLDDKHCLLSTTDFFPPMVADARTFGRIAAANALSDIYAMGGKPLYALNIVCFPQDLDKRILQEILAGGAEKCTEAGASLAGGHSIYDDGIKYGLAVTGIAESDKYYCNNTPRVGDKLILTKPLGVGIVTAAYRGNEANAEDIEETISSMERLNKYAAEKAANFDISACTDITGFGLIAHLLEMLAGKTSAEIYVDNLPHLSNIKHYIEEDWITGGGKRNRDFVGTRVDTSKLPQWILELMFDPQTSGGLLLAVKAEQADGLLKSIQTDDPKAAIVGCIKQPESYEVTFC